MRRRLFQLLVVALALAVAVVAVDVVVRYSDGDFSGDYQLTGVFSRADFGLEPGSAVVHRGVHVGRVTTIALHHGHAQVQMAIDPSFRIPTDVVAVIEPINVFGADQISLDFPEQSTDPTLRPGATITTTKVAPGLENLFAAAAPLLSRLDTTDLNTVLTNLAQAAQGEGPTMRASIDEGAKLASFLDETLPAQIAALDSFTGFAQALAPTASSFDSLGASSNRLLPALNANSAAYKQLLATLTPFAENLAQFLSAYHPDIETLLAKGADVSRLILADRQDIGTLVSGLAVYEDKIRSVADPAEVLPNGTIFAYFDVFLTLKNLNQLICGLLDPAVPGLSFLAPLRQALTGAGTPIQCPAATNASTATTTTTTPTASSASGASVPASSASGPLSAAAQAARNLSTDLYGALGAPTSSGSSAGSGSSASSSGSGALRQILGGLL